MTQDEALQMAQILEGFYPSQTIPIRSEENFMVGLKGYSVEEAKIAIPMVAKSEKRFPSWYSVEEQLKLVRNRNEAMVTKLPEATMTDNDRDRCKRFCQYVIDMVTTKNATELAPDGKPWNIYISGRLHDEFGCPDSEPCEHPGCKGKAK